MSRRATVWCGEEAVFSRARVADSSWDRLLGLLPRVGLDPEEAMVFPGCSSLHTFFMRFAIDVAFLARTGEVVRLFREVNRGRMLFGGAESDAAIECGARMLERHGVELGQRLTWTEN